MPDNHFNRLYFGDNLDILREYVADESVDLIYLDPPFNSNATYNVLFRERSGEESAAQITAFEDTWHWGWESETAFQDMVMRGPEKVGSLLSALRPLQPGEGRQAAGVFGGTAAGDGDGRVIRGYNGNAMMELWLASWGDIATVVGIVVSLGGLGWAIKEARGARSASQAAETAASETRDQIARHLQTVDLHRAIGLIERIKTLHDNDRWEAAREHYQALRAMLSDVIARCPENQTEFREKLATARAIIRDTENFVRERIGKAIEDLDRSQLNQSLNDIQSELEELASVIGFGDSQGETT